MAWQNFFLPHKDTHKKAHLISWEAILIYVLFFILLQVSFSIINYTKPGVLGVTSNIDKQRVIELTNAERTKAGLNLIAENSALDQAAAAKAQNMFSENYWAHFAPSGKSPWDFILGTGYKFSYAGENLAKNFSTSEDVVTAWMNSPSHKDNLLSSKYREIGVAVVDGILDGQRTTLVVQMFGTPTQLLAKAETTQPSTETVAEVPQPASRAEMTVSGQKINLSNQEYEQKSAKPFQLASLTSQLSSVQPILNPYLFFKTSGILLIGFIFVILTLDILVLYKRGVFRISSNHIAHMSLLAISAAALITSNGGSIL